MSTIKYYEWDYEYQETFTHVYGTDLTLFQKDIFALIEKENRMSMSCLLHKILQRDVQCSKYTLI
jgi:hypothetical protein